MNQLRTFGNGGLDVGALADDGVIGDAVLLLHERIGDSIFGGGGGGELDLGDKQPLQGGEGYADEGASRDDNLGSEIRQQRRSAHCFTTRRIRDHNQYSCAKYL